MQRTCLQIGNNCFVELNKSFITKFARIQAANNSTDCVGAAENHIAIVVSEELAKASAIYEYVEYVERPEVEEVTNRITSKTVLMISNSRNVFKKSTWVEKRKYALNGCRELARTLTFNHIAGLILVTTVDEASPKWHALFQLDKNLTRTTTFNNRR